MPGTDLEMPGYLNWLTRLEFWNFVSVVLDLVSLCSICNCGMERVSHLLFSFSSGLHPIYIIFIRFCFVVLLFLCWRSQCRPDLEILGLTKVESWILIIHVLRFG